MTESASGPRSPEGGPYAPVYPRHEDGFIGAYFRQVWRILSDPIAFFREMPLSGGAGGPLAFALVNHWLGAALGFLWTRLLAGLTAPMMERALKIFQDVSDVDHPGRGAQIIEMQKRMMSWVWGAGSVVVDPFLTLIGIAFTSLLVFVGARLLIPSHAPLQGDGQPRPEITYESALRVVCYGLTPAILGGLPLFGGAIAMIFTVITTVLAAREAYRIGTGRAIFVGLFPKILFFSLLGLGLMLMLVVAVRLFTTAF